MKNYITIAALVAAGATCANADVTTTFSSTGTSISNVNIVCDGATVSIDSLKKSASATSTDYTADCLVRNADVTAGFLAPDVNVANAGQWQLTLSYSDLASDFTLSEIVIETMGFNGQNAWQNTGAGAAPTGETSPTTTPSNSAAGKYVKFTVEYAVGASSNWVDLGTFSIDVSGGSTSAGAENFRQTTYVLPEALLELLDDSLQIRISTSQDYTAGTFAGIRSVSLIEAAIPEPSAFGLLAGLGALALVGARRRRK